ncbi:MAG TPA: efflux RND transporter periplasmic adaptor subunit [Thermoleophilia bacterium]|nr:efflux RND transporter periplasmic adaptor subunit [Thermoleophilia bacterium]
MKGAIVLILAVLLVSGAAGYTGYQRWIAASPPASSQPVKVQSGPLVSAVTAKGFVVATRQARLTFSASGMIKEVLVSPGQSVHAGRALAILESDDLKVRLEQARSNVRVAQLKRDRVFEMATPKEIDAAKAALAAAGARVEDLTAGPSNMEIQAAETAVAAAEASLASTRAWREQLKAGAAAAELAAAEHTIAAARANLQKAEADLAKLKEGCLRCFWWTVQRPLPDAGARPEDLMAAELDVASARKSIESAEARQRQLLAGPNETTLQAAISAEKAAEANRLSAQVKLQQLRAGVKASDIQAAQASVANAAATLAALTTPRASELALAEEEVRQAELGAARAESALEAAVLRAPFDGVVAAVSANVGEQASASTTVISLVDPRALRVDATVDETDVAKLKPGQQAEVTFDTVGGRRFPARVALLPLGTQLQGVTTYQVLVDFDPGEAFLPAGMRAGVDIVVERKDNVLRVPNQAVRRQGREHTVEVLVDGKREARPVRVGISNDQFTEIVEGLNEDDMVLLPSGGTLAFSPN